MGWGQTYVACSRLDNARIVMSRGRWQVAMPTGRLLVTRLSLEGMLCRVQKQSPNRR